MSMPPPFDGARPEYPSHAGREAGGSNPFGGVSPTPPGPGGVTGQPPSPTGSWDPQAPSTHQAGPLQGDHRQPFAHGPGYPHWDSRPQPSIAPMAAAPSRRGGKRKWALVGAAVAVVVAIGAGVTVTVISGGSGKNTSTAESQPSARRYLWAHCVGFFSRLLRPPRRWEPTHCQVRKRWETRSTTKPGQGPSLTATAYH